MNRTGGFYGGLFVIWMSVVWYWSVKSLYALDKDRYNNPVAVLKWSEEKTTGAITLSKTIFTPNKVD